MNNQKPENTTYITGVEDENKDGSCNEYCSKKLSNNNNKILKAIDNSDSKVNENIISIVFPTIKTHTNKKLSKLLSSSHKFLKLKKEQNKNEQIYKSTKNISVAISKFRNHSKKILFHNNNENDSKSNNTNNNHCITSDVNKNKPTINQIECNLNLDNLNLKLDKRIKSPSSSPSKNYIFKQKLYNKEQETLLFDKFFKNDKIKLSSYFLKRFSPRLLRRKNTKNNNTINQNEESHENKYSTIIFKNQAIPYIEQIDVSKLSSILPPIILGSRYNLHEKSSDIIEKEKFYNELEKIDKEKKKVINENNKKISKKEMLQMIKDKKLLKYKFLIHKTQNTISKTKRKINKDYNKLKISLNQFDDWNDPENNDNLYEF